MMARKSKTAEQIDNDLFPPKPVSALPPIPENYYVNNTEFYEACKKYLNHCVLAKTEGHPKPRMPEYIGSCILKIATKLSYSRNFIGYPYREEMVGDALENCLLYFHNFDPVKYTNPFSYFTQISYYAFIRRIEREKKLMYTKYKSMQNMQHEGLFDSQDTDSASDFDVNIDEKLMNNDYMKDFINNFEIKAEARRVKRAKKKGVEPFFDDASIEEDDG